MNIKTYGTYNYVDKNRGLHTLRYHARPYLFFGMGSNMLKRYKIEPKRLTIQQFLKEDKVISLPEDVSITIHQSKIRHAFKLGKVEIKTRNDHIFCDNIRSVDQFCQALRGEHPSILAELEARGDKAAEQERFNNLNDSDLHPVTLFYPKFPKIIADWTDLKRLTHFGRKSLIFKVDDGAFVSEGQLIAVCGDFSVTAPHEGRIEFLSNIADPFVDWQKMDYKGAGSEAKFQDKLSRDDCYLFGLRPTKYGMKTNGRLKYYSSIRNSFDNGNVYKDMSKNSGLTFHTYVDQIAAAAKRIHGFKPDYELPNEMNDQVQKLDQCWQQINQCFAFRQSSD